MLLGSGVEALVVASLDRRLSEAEQRAAIALCKTLSREGDALFASTTTAVVALLQLLAVEPDRELQHRIVDALGYVIEDEPAQLAHLLRSTPLAGVLEP
jgi:hypothetical protein